MTYGSYFKPLLRPFKERTFKMMKYLKIIALITVIGCNTMEEELDLKQEILFPDGFDYATTQNSVVNVSALDNKDVGMAGIPFDVFVTSTDGKQLAGSGQTDENGTLQLNLPIGNHMDGVVVSSTYLGIPQSLEEQISSSINFTFGGASPRRSEREGSASNANGRVNSGFTFIGSYDSQGVPHYLEPVDDYISQDLLDLVNNSLPERYPVPIYNPGYIDDDVISDTQLRDSAEVWVTFVHEGAGWRNSLGYYSYDLNNPPSSVDDIETLNIIFPNVSFTGSGGDMKSGNKVSLGTFPANTGIGWFLVPQGWSGSGVNGSNQIKYSNKDFNTFTSQTFRNHTVLLKDEARELLILGMEDTSRPSGDNDFNDAVFYVTANPFTAIITTDLSETPLNDDNDSDGDGVSDDNDNYPDDPDRAFDIYTPSEGSFGSLAFEDLYPSKGDFDMNDMVIDYSFQAVTNVANKVVDLKARFKLKALGAMIHSGYGFTLPIDPSKISSITGQDVVTNEQVVLNANGTENGQSNAVIIVFEDAFRSWEAAYGRTNTISSNGYITPKEYELTITFTEPISNLSLGYAPYDPFIFHTQERGTEVHLSNGIPTDKANLSFDYDDDRLVGNNYQTYDGLPYGINLPVEFDYPEEEESMSDAFLFFDTWAQSTNTQFRDWYVNQPGYRSTTKIYQKD